MNPRFRLSAFDIAAIAFVVASALAWSFASLRRRWAIRGRDGRSLVRAKVERGITALIRYVKRRPATVAIIGIAIALSYLLIPASFSIKQVRTGELMRNEKGDPVVLRLPRGTTPYTSSTDDYADAVASAVKRNDSLATEIYRISLRQRPLAYREILRSCVTAAPGKSPAFAGTTLAVLHNASSVRSHELERRGIGTDEALRADIVSITSSALSESNLAAADSARSRRLIEYALARMADAIRNTPDTSSVSVRIIGDARLLTSTEAERMLWIGPGRSRYSHVTWLVSR